MAKQTVCMIYGFGEDDWNGRAFVAALRKAGYKVIKDAAKADIVIAHSAGVFYLPDTGREQLTVLIGPPFWPGRSMFVCFLIKAWRDFWYHRSHGLTRVWFRKTLHNTLYILGGLRKAIAIARYAHRQNFYLALQQKRVLIIRNEHDAFLTPDADKILSKHADFKFRTVPDEHDDCWLHPERYIDLLQSEV
jgi:hypothetical protein